MTKASLLHTILYGVACTTMGMIIGLSSIDDGKDHIKIFQRDNQQNIIRSYRDGKADNIYIQDLKDSSKYNNLNSYLKGIENEYDRDIEESKIKKLVDW